MADERVVSETGGEKGTKLARFSLIPWTIIRELAEHYGRGSRKYEDRNWERGYPWSASYDALQRHLESFWARDEIDHDPELYRDGEPHTARHIVAVLWHACCLAYFSRYRVGQDDRPQLPDEPSEPANLSLSQAVARAEQRLSGALTSTGSHQGGPLRPWGGR